MTFQTVYQSETKTKTTVKIKTVRKTWHDMACELVVISNSCEPEFMTSSSSEIADKFMTIIVTLQLGVTLDSIRNSCNVLCIYVLCLCFPQILRVMTLQIFAQRHICHVFLFNVFPAARKSSSGSTFWIVIWWGLQFAQVSIVQAHLFGLLFTKVKATFDFSLSSLAQCHNKNQVSVFSHY